MLDERLGKLHFWLTFIGFHTTFLVQHWLGNEGMPRRYADYQPQDGFTALNTVSTLGAFILGVAALPFVWNVWKSYRYGELAVGDDPWGHGNSLEWATSCPPPLRNFDRMPRIRSERPAFEAHHGSLAGDRPRSSEHASRPGNPDGTTR
jgi:cytochrome c oxidase subunit 1